MNINEILILGIIVRGYEINQFQPLNMTSSIEFYSFVYSTLRNNISISYIQSSTNVAALTSLSMSPEGLRLLYYLF